MGIWKQGLAAVIVAAGLNAKAEAGIIFGTGTLQDGRQVTFGGQANPTATPEFSVPNFDSYMDYAGSNPNNVFSNSEFSVSDGQILSVLDEGETSVSDNDWQYSRSGSGLFDGYSFLGFSVAFNDAAVVTFPDRSLSAVWQLAASGAFNQAIGTLYFETAPNVEQTLRFEINSFEFREDNSVSAVPEPSSMLLVATGLIAAAGAAARKKKDAALNEHAAPSEPSPV